MTPRSTVAVAERRAGGGAPPTPTGDLPRITVVTPSLNQGAFIEATIESVLGQGYPNLEYLVLDGGSTDETLAILDRYAERIDCVVVAPDGGQSDAIAKGFEMATGDVLAWLCADDLYLPGALHWVADQFRLHPEIDLLCGETRLDQGRGWEEWQAMRYGNSTPTVEKLIACGQVVQQPGCFWRAAAYRRTAGVDRELRFCMDYGILLELCRVGRARYVDHEIAWMRSHPAAKSSTMHDVREHERRRLAERALGWTSASATRLCTLAYLDSARRALRHPRSGPRQRWAAVGRLAGGYLYRLLRGDVRRWHPIDGFGG